MSVVTKLYISETQISSHEIEANGEIIKKGGVAWGCSSSLEAGVGEDRIVLKPVMLLFWS